MVVVDAAAQSRATWTAPPSLTASTATATAVAAGDRHV
jgi:hypothetical protein